MSRLARILVGAMMALGMVTVAAAAGSSVAGMGGSGAENSPAPGAAAAHKEVATAIEHATYATQMNTVDKTHLHLHHVVNCLVGPGGKGFYPAAGDPCKGMGNGAIHDAGNQTGLQKKLEAALAAAQSGLATSDQAKAHADAVKTKSLLEDAQGTKGSNGKM
ncbi:MAG TPA: hypothetical protein VFA86_07615 [Gammaproteobacteria bacterium]|nr:hypothetical protein [Gammaproteobacteria bacterium]